MRFLIKLFLTTVSVLLCSYLFGRHVYVDDFVAALAFSAVMAFFNVTLRPILILLTIPATVLTLGLLLLVINAVLIMLADALVPGIDVDGFWWALLFSLVLSVLTSFFNEQIGEKKEG